MNPPRRPKSDHVYEVATIDATQSMRQGSWAPSNVNQNLEFVPHVTQSRCGLMLVDRTFPDLQPDKAFAADQGLEYRRLQRSPQERILFLLQPAADYLQTTIPRPATPQQIASAIVYQRSLGQGTYGSVCRADFIDKRTFPYSIAVKRLDAESENEKVLEWLGRWDAWLSSGPSFAPRPRQETYALSENEKRYAEHQFNSAIGEVIFTAATARLVLDGLSANFALMYHWTYHQLVNPNDGGYVEIFTELADGDLSHAVFQTAAEFMSCAFQTFHALCMMAREYRMINSDLFLKNVLYTVIPVGTHNYPPIPESPSQEQIKLVQHGYLAKITDFSLARSPVLAEQFGMPKLDPSWDRITFPPKEAQNVTAYTLLSLQTIFDGTVNAFNGESVRSDTDWRRRLQTQRGIGNPVPIVRHFYLPRYAIDPVAFLIDTRNRWDTLIPDRSQGHRVRDWVNASLNVVYGFMVKNQKPVAFMDGNVDVTTGRPETVPIYASADTGPGSLDTPSGLYELVRILFSPKMFASVGFAPGEIIDTRK